MCMETSYVFESRECGCVYVHVVVCKDARVPVAVDVGRVRWPKCKGKKGVRKIDGGVLGSSCWEVDGGKEKRCEKRLVFLKGL